MGRTTNSGKQTGTSIRGRAQSIEKNTVNRHQIWHFLVIVKDKNHKELNRIPVEIKSTTITGIINEGDEVEIFEKWEPPKTMIVFRVFNHTNNSEIVATDNLKSGRKMLVGCLTIVFLIVLIFYLLFHNHII